jgi:hypothetical protein
LSTLEKTLCRIRNAHPGAELRVCYEAGPTGFVIARRFAQLGIDCAVVAPSLIPNRSGDRVKTDPRDAVDPTLRRLGQFVTARSGSKYPRIQATPSCVKSSPVSGSVRKDVWPGVKE